MIRSGIVQKLVLLAIPAIVTISSIVQVFKPPVARATNCSGTCTSTAECPDGDECHCTSQHACVVDT